jgi:hypothetical protein
MVWLHPSLIPVRRRGVISPLKWFLNVWWQDATLFVYFSYFITCSHSFIQSHSYNTFIHRHSLRPLSISSSLICSVGKHLVASRESNSGLPYSKLTRYQLSHAAPIFTCRRVEEGWEGSAWTAESFNFQRTVYSLSISGIASLGRPSSSGIFQTRTFFSVLLPRFPICWNFPFQEFQDLQIFLFIYYTLW